jgi:hypothetical protein
MKAITRTTVFAAAALATACFTTHASAGGCSPYEALPSLRSPDGPAAPGTAPQAEPRARTVDGFTQAAFRRVGAREAYDDFSAYPPWNGLAPIVGLWKSQFIVTLPSGEKLTVDDGYTTWHADGTELMNSSRPPQTGSFCMGVWKQIGRATFTLNHWALSWENDGVTFTGPTNIRETVTVDRSGKSYVGTFTLTQYLPDGVTVAPDGVATGAVQATRITP